MREIVQVEHHIAAGNCVEDWLLRRTASPKKIYVPMEDETYIEDEFYCLCIVEHRGQRSASRFEAS